MKLVLAIALGGAIGAVGRHYVSVAMTLLLGHGFPWGTLVVNIFGSFLMGVLIEAMALAWSPTAEMRALLTVGVLGAFTTFSTFSLDVAVLYERGASLLLAFYIVTSVAVSILALFAGLRLMRLVLV
ncbi:MAG: fluoride efflux transporter CrcB [Alphaproteobacteria bacterium]|jgi:CrcB protein|nr:fluoride efflux transporter CrcB [Alphaproteobacteria bacterium]MCZ6587696.1 fluoride efflux transporter CrcB [Alphaproteobacteria bacterium]MCZ6591095.1 fluoride efflux transporter CrcB [Alphaproteobacteria bacterium]MCZ6837943.1 fluoride efflux transporter CrcB [Alphaproteobacteria bacterium]MCZ6845288.1 fluoride efflux transporter CrcB [Alphaproteobacteria bacterium]